MKWQVLAVSVVFSSLVATESFAQGAGARAPALRVTNVEAATSRVLARRAATNPSLSGVSSQLAVQKARTGTSINSVPAMLAAMAAIAAGSSNVSASALPTQAEIVAEMNATKAQITLQAAPVQSESSAELAFVSGLAEASSDASCPFAMGKQASSGDMSFGDSTIVTTAETNVNQFFTTVQFFGLNNWDVSQNIVNLSNSGPEGQFDIEVADGLGTVFASALFPVTSNIQILAADGEISSADQEKVQTCTVYWGVQSLAGERGLANGEALATNVATACAVELTGKPAPSSGFASTCRM